MTSPVSLTQKWLRQNIQSYLHKDRVFIDIDASLSRFSTLRPKTDVYTYDDGRTQLLLCVHGLLPITFRNATYNIPLALWITRDYPKEPPIAYVVPTNDMLVRPARYVDVSGKCSPEYLRNWERKSEGCNLVALLDALQDLFSREPPLVSKPKDRSTPPPPSTSAHDRPLVPPKPRISFNHPSYSTPISPRAPPPNPLPATHTASPVHPSRYKGPVRGSAISHEANQIANLPISSNHRTPQVHADYRDHQNPADTSANVQSLSTLQQSFKPPLVAGSVPVPITDLLDEDTPVVQPVHQAPPRPPNPELLQLHSRLHDKFKSELDSLSQALLSDAERLRALQTDLLDGEPAIRDEMGRLEAVRDVCRTVGGRLFDTVSRAEKNVTELRRRGDPDIDEMVCATTIVHNQLINLVAEDNAIEDTIYQLHRALNAGRIDLDRFLRTTRVLAEEQFMKRALIEKIAIAMPTNQSGGTGWS